jgi:hypothetical protein
MIDLLYAFYSQGCSERWPAILAAPFQPFYPFANTLADSYRVSNLGPSANFTSFHILWQQKLDHVMLFSDSVNPAAM